MNELIIIKTNQSKEIKKLLEEKHIQYEIYREDFNKKSPQSFPNSVEPQKDWETKEKLALREWEKLSDEELINEWEKLPND